MTEVARPEGAGPSWPPLGFDAWRDTCATLHLWTQIVGKVRLVQTPWTNHSWHVPLYVTARGLTTSAIPHGARSFSIDFDFVDHALRVETSDGGAKTMPLRPRSVADFYGDVMATLADLGVPVRIRTMPNEIPDAVPFDQDHAHAAYDAQAATRFWRALVQVDRVFKVFRAWFVGKCSPVHFFWGSFDLAVTRFSGREAPPHPGGVPNMPDWVAREAYSHEVSSAGFWPGNATFPEPIFYSYAYPEPKGFRDARVDPTAARFDATLGEFLLPYEAVRASADPDAILLAFLQSTYEAAARTAGWDRAALERSLGRPG
jgi:Family of unknown function (DUF5996)